MIRRFAIAAACAPLAQAAVIQVPGDYTEIQAAIDAAADGDVVQVAAGTYLETIRFSGKAIRVSGAGAGRSVIDGGAGGSTVTFADHEDSGSVLEHFTITGGNGTSTGIGSRSGGGVFIQGTTWGVPGPTIRACEIAGNRASGLFGYGGGIMVAEASPMVLACDIHDNEAGDPSLLGGGGVALIESRATIAGCRIAGNTSGPGGGISLGDTDALVLNCTVVGNQASGGGGIFVITDGGNEIRNTLVWDNVAPVDPAIHAEGDPPLVEYGCIEGGWPGTGNIASNPDLVDYLAWNDVLNLGSPCIDAGDPDSGFDDSVVWPPWYANGARSDIGAYGGPTIFLWK